MMIRGLVSVAALMGGYACLYSFLKRRTDCAVAREAVGCLAGIVYAVVLGVLALIRQYLGETGLVVYFVSIVYSCFFAGWTIRRLIRRRPVVCKRMLSMLGVYLFALLYMTLFMREAGSQHAVQLDVFHWLEPRGNGSPISPIGDLCLNIALFAPLGVLIQLAIPGVSRWAAVSFALTLSTLVETIQFVVGMGTFDVLDILGNTLGSLLGVLAFSAVKGHVIQEKTTAHW